MLVKAAGLAIDLCLCCDILSYRVPSVSTRGVDIMQWPLAAELPHALCYTWSHHQDRQHPSWLEPRLSDGVS